MTLSNPQAAQNARKTAYRECPNRFDAALFKRLVLTLKMGDLIEDERYLAENANIS